MAEQYHFACRPERKACFTEAIRRNASDNTTLNGLIDARPMSGSKNFDHCLPLFYHNYLCADNSQSSSSKALFHTAHSWGGGRRTTHYQLAPMARRNTKFASVDCTLLGFILAHSNVFILCMVIIFKFRYFLTCPIIDAETRELNVFLSKTPLD